MFPRRETCLRIGVLSLLADMFFSFLQFTHHHISMKQHTPVQVWPSCTQGFAKAAQKWKVPSSDAADMVPARQRPERLREVSCAGFIAFA